MSANGKNYVNGIEMKRTSAVTQEIVSQVGEFPLDSYVQFVFKHTNGVCLKDRTLSFENGVFNLRLVPPLSSTERIDYSDFCTGSQKMAKQDLYTTKIMDCTVLIPMYLKLNMNRCIRSTT